MIVHHQAPKLSAVNVGRASLSKGQLPTCAAMGVVRRGVAVLAVSEALVPPAAALTGLLATAALAAALAEAERPERIPAEIRTRLLPLLWLTRRALRDWDEPPHLVQSTLQDFIVSASLGVAVFQADRVHVWGAGPINAGIVSPDGDLVLGRDEGSTLGGSCTSLAEIGESPRLLLSAGHSRAVFLGTEALGDKLIDLFRKRPEASRTTVAEHLARQAEDLGVAWASFPALQQRSLAS